MANTTVACTNINLLKESQIPASPSQTELYAVELDGKPLTQANISNCITSIPQDIKLELNNGTLTLKAGSKVYVPNGYGVFNAVTIASDVSFSNTSLGNRTALLIYRSNNNDLQIPPISSISSGTITPSSGWYYNTTDNKIYRDGSYEGGAFPLAVITYLNGSGVTSIDKVFNGFGYIGSTVFALPDVKGLVPNGRNADGSLKNTEYTTQNVLLSDRVVLSGDNRAIVLNTYSNKLQDKVYKVDNLTIAPSGQMVYNQLLNNIYDSGGVFGRYLYCGDYDADSNNKITSFTPKTTFHALDYNDKGTISGWGMPSGRYIDLTLGATGATYTAPANGWFSVGKTSSASGQYLNMYIRSGTTNVGGFGLNSSATGQTIRLSLPCTKGNQIAVTYNMAGSSQYDYFRFFYAEGDNT